ncbi:hypothetical protein [Gracilimonas sediminicola]|uniref:Outer membrane protein beta-barrel domain-containing protein n=1 Tax=Gracilimonas sediminicola TaxID=2952158 RepID=A0A9X2L4J1_9BACT|nr:hypothetical protein [Gracilimonas sediminicola]MCP9292251.1 hypothetical protein [Gracilimonas sediminicola]
MYKIIAISFFSSVLLFSTPGIIQAQDNTPTGYYASVHGAYDVMANNNLGLIADGFFTFHLQGTVLTGIDVGKYKGKDNYHISIYRGFMHPYYNINGPDKEPADKAVEIQKLYSLGLTYRKQATRVKKTKRIKVNVGGRVTVKVDRYSGIQARQNADDSWQRPTYTFDDFKMLTPGLEVAPYLEVGKQTPGEKGLFLNWEYLYFRVGYQHVALGVQKVSIVLKF